MTFYDFPQVNIPKEQKPLKGMSKQTAEKRFTEKCGLKRQLLKKLKKCERDLMKYYLTMNK